ncbi:MAG: hypothetical protein A2046_00525 [Bacteroidetes bacterium GWA2_30_7]|nr:MAG: hypothetical protein A2046_00525 [Bacteroidetes bacterium GWA2_30_7]
MKTNIIISVMVAIFIAMIIINSCNVSQKISEKSGAQLWGETCIRCHNTPPPTSYSDAQWQTVVTHMKVRANLTDEETKKIVDFLQTAN